MFDCRVQTQIVQGLERTDLVIEQVRRTLSRLEVELQSIRGVLEEAESARCKLIERS